MRGDVPQRVRGALARVSRAVGLPLLGMVGHPGLAAAAPWTGCRLAGGCGVLGPGHPVDGTQSQERNHMRPKGHPLSCENSPHTSHLPLPHLGESGTRNENTLRWFPLRVVLCPQNFSLDWCKQPDVGLPKPDLVVFLQLQLAEAAVRGEFGRERYESGPFQQRALQRFQQLLTDPSLPWKVNATWALGLVQKGLLPDQGSWGCSATACAYLGPRRDLPCPEHSSSPGPLGLGAIPVAPAATSCLVPTASGHFQSLPVSSLPVGGVHGSDGPHACQLGSCTSLPLVRASRLPC